MKKRASMMLLATAMCVAGAMSGWTQERAVEIVFTGGFDVFREGAKDYIQEEIRTRKSNGDFYVEATVHTAPHQVLAGENLAWLEGWLQGEPETDPNGNLVLAVDALPDPYAAGVNTWEPHWTAYGWVNAVLEQISDLYHEKHLAALLEANRPQRDAIQAEVRAIQNEIETIEEARIHPLYGESLDPIRERLLALDDDMFKLSLEQARINARRQLLTEHLREAREAQRRAEAEMADQARETARLETELGKTERSWLLASNAFDHVEATVAEARAKLDGIGRKYKPQHPVASALEEEFAALLEEQQAAEKELLAQERKIEMLRGQLADLGSERQTSSADDEDTAERVRVLEEELRHQEAELQAMRSSLSAGNTTPQTLPTVSTGWLDEMLIDAEVRSAEVEAAMALNRERQEELRALLAADKTRRADIDRLERQIPELGVEYDRLASPAEAGVKPFPKPEVRFIEPEPENKE